MLIALESMEWGGEEGLKLEVEVGKKKKKAVPQSMEHTHKMHKSMHVSVK